jgi:hypothetical protein
LGIVALLEKTVDTTNWELEASELENLGGKTFKDSGELN